MKNRIITIGREFGSGGRTIGRMAAQQLGIPCYDQEIIEKLVEKGGFSAEYIKERGELMVSEGWNAVLGRTGGPTRQDQLWVMQKNLILELAEQGPCVIVGRCADFILSHREDVLKVFVRSTMQKRSQRILQVYGQREESAEQRLRIKDHQRAEYYKMYTGHEWGGSRYYDLVLNSAKFSLEACVKTIIDLYQADFD